MHSRDFEAPQPSLRTAANALRLLSIDAVEAAQSGQPGMPMGMADIATVLWRSHLKHNPADPQWWDRDRFVLSHGHGSMLLYALLHLTGYDVTLDDLKAFRQAGSPPPGHPEVGHTPGVEATTGPPGQGLANAVGMALAEKMLAARYNEPGLPVVDHRTYAFVGDGCLMEGVSHEACALAGVWQLAKLTVLYDDNRPSIDGDTAGWYRDETVARFRAYGWNVIGPVDGHAPGAIDRAIRLSHASRDKPTLIVCRTRIGCGSPKLEGTADAHGTPLGAEEVRATRAALGWPHGPFEIPLELRAFWDGRANGTEAQAEWQARFDLWSARHPDDARELGRRMRGELPDDWAGLCHRMIEAAHERTANAATRTSSRQALVETLWPLCPNCGAAPPTSRDQISPPPATPGRRTATATATTSTTASASSAWPR